MKQMNETPTFNFSCGECGRPQETPVHKLSFGFSSQFCETHGSHIAIDLMAVCDNCGALNLSSVRDDVVGEEHE